MDNSEKMSAPDQPEIQLQVTENMRSYIYDTAKWASFLSKVGFVVSGFMIIVSFTLGSAMNTNPELSKMIMSSSLSPMGFTIFFLVFAFAIFYPSLLLFKYSTKAKIGCLYGEQESLEDATRIKRSLFKYWGTITLAFIILYLLSIVLGVIATVSGS